MSVGRQKQQRERARREERFADALESGSMRVRKMSRSEQSSGTAQLRRPRPIKSKALVDWEQVEMAPERRRRLALEALQGSEAE